MRPSQRSQLWYVPRPDDLLWASWGEAYVAYHRPSGKTHFLNAASHTLLTELLQTPLGISAIARDLNPQEGGDEGASDQDRQQLGALLNQLEQLGLVQRA